MTNASPTAASAAAMRDGKDGNHDADRGLGLRTETPESDEIEIGRGEHQFDADENENGVTPAEGGEQSGAKQRRGDDEEKLKGGCHWTGSTRASHAGDRALAIANVFCSE